MDVIVLVATDRNGKPVDGARFEYSVDGGETFSPAQQDDIKWSFAVPSAGQLRSIVIRGTPTAPQYWEAEGAFKVDPSGAIIAAARLPNSSSSRGRSSWKAPQAQDRPGGGIR